MRVAGAASEHPETSHATGEVAGRLLEAGLARPDLLLVAVTRPHVLRREEMTTAFRALLSPARLVVVIAPGVIGGSREVEHGPGLVALALASDGISLLSLRAAPSDAGVRLRGLDPLRLADAHSVLLLADGTKLPADALLRHLADRHPHLTVAGALLPPPDPAPALTVVDGTAAPATVDALAVVFDGSTRLDVAVASGCRPIGDPMIVTRAEERTVLELAGERAVDRLAETLRELDPDDRELAVRGLHAGLVVDERPSEFGPGDFLVRSVQSLDRESGGVVVGDRIEVGRTLQFLVRDAGSADDDLRRSLTGQPPDAALLLVDRVRGEGLFGVPHHDARVASEALDPSPVVGFFGSALIGPAGGRPHLHSAVAVTAGLVDGRRGRRR